MYTGFCVVDDSIEDNLYIEKDGETGFTSGDERVGVGDRVDHYVKLKVDNCNEW